MVILIVNTTYIFFIYIDFYNNILILVLGQDKTKECIEKETS